MSKQHQILPNDNKNGPKGIILRIKNIYLFYEVPLWGVEEGNP